jgi:hypothetical protein
VNGGKKEARLRHEYSEQIELRHGGEPRRAFTKLIRAARYYGSYIDRAFVAERIETPNDSSLLMASVYDIKLFVRDNGRRNAYR